MTNSRPVADALGGHGSETAGATGIPPSEGNEARRDGRRGVGVPHSTDDAGEPTRGTPPREGGGRAMETAGGKDDGDTEP